MPIFNNILAGASGQATGYDIDQSLRFEDGDNAYLKRTVSTGNKKTWTWSGWVKKSTLTTGHGIFGTETSGTANFFLMQWTGGGSGDSIFIQGYTSSSETTRLLTERKFRDPSAWYHIVLAVDTTQSTASNRLKLYVNGEQITDFASGSQTYPNSEDLDTAINDSSYPLMVGAYSTGTPDTLGGYLAEVNFIDGQALTPASFGETNSATNQWVPIEVTGMTYGTNGFYQKYSATELANSFEDSAEGYVINANGNVHTDTSVKKIGTASAEFDGTDDYISIEPSSEFEFSATDSFTLEGWVRFKSIPGSGPYYMFSLAGIRVSWDQNYDNWYCIAGTNDGTWSNTPSVDTWYHLAVVGDGTNVKLYIDGTERISFAQAGTVGSSTATAYFGTYDGDLFDFDGYMDEVRLSSSARYTSSFTPSTTAFTTDANTSLLLHMDGSDGGTVFTDSSGYDGPRHTITANGDVVNTRSIGNFECEYLVVAGGGGGGKEGGGGGGGGGMRTGTTNLHNGNTYTITVGAGGAGSSSSAGAQGGDSKLGNVIVSAGGGKGMQDAGNGSDGGSGGGAGYSGNAGGGNTPSTSPSQGANSGAGGPSGGGASNSHSAGGGGGGGASGTAGADGTNSSGSGNGGNGTASSISGSSVTYAGGGGGGTIYFFHSGSGGTGGGGDSGQTSGSSGSDGTNGLGGGGGGASGTGTTHSGGDGGNGIVIIRYKSATNLATGGTITTDGDYKIHTFTADGTFTVTGATRPGTSAIEFDGTGDYLSVPASSDWEVSASNSDSFTVEAWVKLDLHDAQETFVGQSASGSTLWRFRNYHGNGVSFQVYDAGSLIVDVSGAEIADTDWHHVALVKVGNGSDSTYTLYKDGTSIGTSTDSSTLTVNGQLDIGSSYSAGDPFDGYMDEIRISNSARYTGAFTPSTTAFTADANTLLLIHSDFNGGLGADSSGNKNDFSATNLVATDQVLDSPTNNFATFFPTGVDPDTDKAISEGNLKVTFNSGSSGTAHSTLAINDGNKWYAEFLVLGTPASGEPVIGIDNNIGWSSGIGYNGSTTNDSIGYVATDGKIYKGGSLVDTESTFTTNDIIQVAFDGSTGRIYFGKNNTWQNSGDPAGGTGYVTTAALEASYIGFACGGHSTGSQAVVANFGQDSSFAGEKTAQGNGGVGEDFYYSPPTGFKALNTDNFDDPAIPLPGDYFNTVLWSGSSSAQAITGVGFSPDSVWTKRRNATGSHYLWDTVRGNAERLEINSIGAEETQSGQWTSFDSDGFTLGGGSDATNNTGGTYVAWNWKAGGTASSNTDGTITSSVSANTDAGFSIVSWTGTGSNATVGHGLSQAPELIINKSRGDAYNWAVQSFLWNSASDTNLLYLNTNAAQADDTNVFQAAPTATVFSPQGGSWAGIGTNTIQYIAYCFHGIDGYSKVGTYVGNGSSTDGAFVYTGFRPSYILQKVSSSTSNWLVFDNKRTPYNVVNKYLTVDTNGAESEETVMDFLSNGFKFRQTSASFNASQTYIYLAIAESPFKTSNGV